MGIQFVVILLTYLMVIVLAYEGIVFITGNEKKSVEIINVAFKRAYIILFFSLLVVYSIVIHPFTDVDYETTSFLILGSKFISMLTLGGSLFLLNKKRYKKPR